MLHTTGTGNRVRRFHRPRIYQEFEWYLSLAVSVNWVQDCIGLKDYVELRLSNPLECPSKEFVCWEVSMQVLLDVVHPLLLAGLALWM